MYLNHLGGNAGLRRVESLLGLMSLLGGNICPLGILHIGNKAIHGVGEVWLKGWDVFILWIGIYTNIRAETSVAVAAGITDMF